MIATSAPPPQAEKKGRGRPPGSKTRAVLHLPAAAPPALCPQQVQRKAPRVAGAKAARKKDISHKHAVNGQSVFVPDAYSPDGMLIENCLKEIKAVTKSNSIARAYASHIVTYNAKGFPSRASSFTTCLGSEQLTGALLADRHLRDDVMCPDDSGAHAHNAFRCASFNTNGQGGGSSSSGSSSSSNTSTTCEDLWTLLDSQGAMAPLSATSAHPLELLDMSGLGDEYDDLLSVPAVDPPQGSWSDPASSASVGGSFYYNRVLSCIISTSPSPRRKNDKTKGGSKHAESGSYTHSRGALGDYADDSSSCAARGACSLGPPLNPQPSTLRASTCNELFKAGFIRPTDQGAHQHGVFGKTHWMLNMEEAARARQADDEVCVDLRRKMADLRRVNSDNSIRLLKLKNTLTQREYIEEGAALLRRAEEERTSLQQFLAYVKRTAEDSRRREEQDPPSLTVSALRPVRDHVAYTEYSAPVGGQETASEKRPRVGL